MVSKILCDIIYLWPTFLISISSSAISSISNSLLIYLLKPLTNEILILNKIDFFSFLHILLISLTKGTSTFISHFFSGQLNIKIELHFRNKLFKAFLQLPIHFYESYSSKGICSKLFYNVEQISEIMSSTIITIVQDGFLTLGLLTVMFLINWRMSLFVSIFILATTFIVRKVGIYLRRMNYKIQKRMSRAMYIAEMTIKNHNKSVKKYSKNQQSRKFNMVLKNIYEQKRKSLILSGASYQIIQVIGLMITIIGIYMTKNSNQNLPNVGSLISFYASSIMILKPIKNISQAMHKVQKIVAMSKSIFDIIDHSFADD